MTTIATGSDTELATEELVSIPELSREIRDLAKGMGRDYARALVDLYYRWQDHRITLHNQMRAALEAGEPVLLLERFAAPAETLERQMVSVLNIWTDDSVVGRWSKEQKGIGPILAAGLLAHIDIARAETVGAIWRFAGLDPTSVWKKGERRPWNADLKVLCWKVGDSFVKVSGREDAFYGQLYRQRKAYEVERDLSGGNAETAAHTLRVRNIKDPDTRKIYESGHLPAGRLDLRARRWAVKLFLAHWFEVAYEDHHGRPAPLPYPIAQLGHVHTITRPG
jgi:hypothetical protein